MTFEEAEDRAEELNDELNALLADFKFASDDSYFQVEAFLADEEGFEVFSSSEEEEAENFVFVTTYSLKRSEADMLMELARKSLSSVFGELREEEETVKSDSNGDSRYLGKIRSQAQKIEE